MNAQLQTIDTRAIERPVYNNRHLQRGALWIRDNTEALRNYYAALGGRLPDSGSANATAEFPYAQKFIAWASCQLDIERLKA